MQRRGAEILRDCLVSVLVYIGVPTGLNWFVLSPLTSIAYSALFYWSIIPVCAGLWIPLIVMYPISTPDSDSLWPLLGYLGLHWSVWAVLPILWAPLS